MFLEIAISYVAMGRRRDERRGEISYNEFPYRDRVGVAHNVGLRTIFCKDLGLKLDGGSKRALRAIRSARTSFVQGFVQALYDVRRCGPLDGLDCEPSDVAFQPKEQTETFLIL
jgi:hypothetical protein